jgi:tetratricopeptide (TPR) repeat protein
MKRSWGTLGVLVLAAILAIEEYGVNGRYAAAASGQPDNTPNPKVQPKSAPPLPTPRPRIVPRTPAPATVRKSELASAAKVEATQPKPVQPQAVSKPKTKPTAPKTTPPAYKPPPVQPPTRRVDPPRTDQPSNLTRYYPPWYPRYQVVWPGEWGGYGYNPYAGYGYPYGYPSAYSYGGYQPYGYSGEYPSSYSPYLPYAPYYPYSPYYAFRSPIFMPAGAMFGLGPIQRMMGVDHWFNPPAAGGGAGARADLGAGGRDPTRKLNRDGAPDDKPLAERGTNSKATALAWRFIGFGDAHFGNQKYSDALDRYKKAAQSAPQVADAWFRQGLALAATGRYDAAVKTIKRGLEIKPDWAASDFSLNTLYGGDDAAKKAQLDAMAKAAEEQPANGDLMLLLGIHLHFDGQKDRAAPFFKRASEIGGNDDAVKGFAGK